MGHNEGGRYRGPLFHKIAFLFPHLALPCHAPEGAIRPIAPPLLLLAWPPLSPEEAAIFVFVLVRNRV